MAYITIDIPDEQLSQLKQLAQESHISTEDLLRASIEHWLTFPKTEFAEAADYVLKKNAELYRRLA
jgi:predicted transcriptional regulator